MYCVLHTYKRSMITSRTPKTASRRSPPGLRCFVFVAPAAMHHHHRPSLRSHPEHLEPNTVAEAPLEASERNTVTEALAAPEES